VITGSPSSRRQRPTTRSPVDSYSIVAGLERRLPKLAEDGEDEAHEVVLRALTYLKPRRKLMRYAHLRALKLPIGSGATESSCALMQTRVKRPGMAWEPPGLRGILCLRGLVLAERWEAVWPSCSANSRASVEAA
jgi:hypothetical protein